jgi:hypothetical protein
MIEDNNFSSPSHKNHTPAPMISNHHKDMEDMEQRIMGRIDSMFSKMMGKLDSVT